MNSHSEQQLLELTAQAIGFDYLMYVPETYPHASGLLYRNATGRLQMWNPRLNDSDLLQLALAKPNINLHHVIVRACDASTNLASRRQYVRDAFVQAVADQCLPIPAMTAQIVNTDSLP